MGRNEGRTSGTARRRSATAARSRAERNGTTLGFEQTLWAAADKLRGHMDAAEYKHVVLGLVFLKYISDAFERVHAELERDPEADPEDPDEYRAKDVFWVPPEARWQRLQDAAKQPEIGELVDAAMEAIERENPSLRGRAVAGGRRGRAWPAA